MLTQQVDRVDCAKWTVLCVAATHVVADWLAVVCVREYAQVCVSENKM